MKKSPKKIQAVFGLVFFVVVVFGAIIGAYLVQQQQDNRNQASGGALPETSNNEMNLCIVIEAEGKVLETWEKVPPTKFTIKAGPVSSSFDPEKDKLPEKFEDELSDTTFEAPRDTNATLENGMFAVCQVVPKRGARYIYKRLQISSSAEFESPRYTVVKSKDLSFEDYSDQLFDDNTENNEKRNKNADGFVNIGEGSSRKVVIYVKLKSPLIAPTAAATSTPTTKPTVAITLTATPTKQTTSSTTQTTAPTTSISAGRVASLAGSTSTPTPVTSSNTALSTDTPTPSTSILALQAAATNTPTKTPTYTPTHTPTPTNTTSNNQSLTGSNPTPTSSSVSSSSTQSTNTTTGTTPTTAPTSSLLANTNSILPTSTSTQTSKTSSGTTTVLPTAIATVKPRNSTALAPVNLPISGAITDTLLLIFGGIGMMGTGIYLLGKNKTGEKPKDAV